MLARSFLFRLHAEVAMFLMTSPKEVVVKVFSSKTAKALPSMGAIFTGHSFFFVDLLRAIPNSLQQLIAEMLGPSQMNVSTGSPSESSTVIDV